LNHKVLLKENELGISKLKELQTKLENSEKQLAHLSQKILEKEKIISELKEENKKLKFKKEKFENLDIVEHVSYLEFIGMLTCKPIEEDKNRDNEENKILKEKIKKMKDAINELSTKLEKELLIKEQKNIKINENNSKLFENLQKKNKELMKMLKQENLQTMALRKEKYDLETICIKQEDTIRILNKRLSSHSKKKNCIKLYILTAIYLHKMMGCQKFQIALILILIINLQFIINLVFYLLLNDFSLIIIF
jgi:DNA repair exonuclease SbcCD ATPase subunit